MVVAASIVARLIAGKASDRHGRVELMMVGAVLVAVGMTLFSNATSVPMLTAGVVYGLSIGINMPAVFAWTVDLAPEGKAATSLSTMLMALEVGIGGGAVSGTWYATNPEVLLSLYGSCAFLDWRGLPFCSGGGAFTKTEVSPVDNSGELCPLQGPSTLSCGPWRCCSKNSCRRL